MGRRGQPGARACRSPDCAPALPARNLGSAVQIARAVPDGRDREDALPPSGLRAVIGVDMGEPIRNIAMNINPSLVEGAWLKHWRSLETGDRQTHLPNCICRWAVELEAEAVLTVVFYLSTPKPIAAPSRSYPTYLALRSGRNLMRQALA